MNGKNRFLNAMGEIDPEYLKEHIEYKKNRGINLGKMIPITASAAAVIAAVSVAVPFFKTDTVLPPADTTLAVSDTSDASDTKFPVLYSQLSGIASVPEYDTLPADGEVRLSGELKKALVYDKRSDSVYAVSLSYTSSKFIECSSDPVMAEKAEDIFKAYEEQMAAVQENFIRQLEEHKKKLESIFDKYSDEISNIIDDHMGKTTEIIEKYNPYLKEIEEKYPNDYAERAEYKEILTKMFDEIEKVKIGSSDFEQKMKESREDWLRGYEKWQEESSKLREEYMESIRKIGEERAEALRKSLENSMFDIGLPSSDSWLDSDDIVDSWFESDAYQKYRKEVEKVINGDSEADPEKYFRQWFEEYRQKIYKEARGRITKEVYGIDDESTVCSHLDEMKVDYSRLTVKTVSDDDIVTDDNDRIITFMTQEQIENFTAPETIGIDLELAPNDWQDEDSDSIVYSKIRG